MTIALQPGTPGPLYRQLYVTLRDAIVEGALSPGQKLAPTRSLAEDLALSRNTVNAAYDMLVAEGYVIVRKGAGFYVTDLLPDVSLTPPMSGKRSRQASATTAPARGVSRRGYYLARESRRVPETSNPAFQRGYPAIEAFPFRQWQQHIDLHCRRPAPALLRYQDDGGLTVLKDALLDYLRLSRGVRATRDQIIIVAGGQAALDLTSRLLVDEGDSVAIEDPAYPGARDALLAAGARLVPMSVDAHGMAVGSLPGKGAGLVYVTPSYQFPLGVTLSAPRRVQLLNWAEHADAYIVEDDYDSEFRYRGRPLSSLQGLDGGRRVIYVGTFSKVMFPGLRLGYVVAPTHLAGAFKAALRKTGQDTPLLLQAAMADFITSGQFASHIRKMRTLYGERQAAFVTLAHEYLSDWLEVAATDAGMQLACPFKAATIERMDETRLLIAAQERGIDIALLSSYYLTGCRCPGLFLGYAGVPVADMAVNIDALAGALASATKS